MPNQLRLKQEFVNSRTKSAKKWIAEYLLLMRHNPPNADSPSAQISKLSPGALYGQYTKWADAGNEVPIHPDGFRGVFSTVFQSLNLVMRNSKQGTAQCWVCSLLKEFLKQTGSTVQATWVKSLQLEHLAFHAKETAAYEDTCFRAKDPQAGIISINTDGAKQEEQTLPKISSNRKAKNLPEWNQKLQGVLLHGKGISLYNI